MNYSATTLLERFLKTINTIGERNVTELLNNAIDTGGGEVIIDFLRIEASKAFRVPAYKLRSPQNHRLEGRLKPAISCICWLTNKHLKYSHEEVSKYVLHSKKKDRATPSKYKKYIDTLDPKHIEDKPVYEALIKMESNLIAYIEKLNTEKININ